MIGNSGYFKENNSGNIVKYGLVNRRPARSVVPTLPRLWTPFTSLQTTDRRSPDGFVIEVTANGIS